MNKGKIVVCFCEDITLEEIVQAIKEGYDEIETVKRFTGLGTGLCQGRLCLLHALEILAKETQLSVESLKLPTPRSPITPIALGKLAETQVK